VNSNLVSWLGLVFTISEVGLAIARRSRSSNSLAADRSSLLLLWVVIVISMTFAYSFAYTLPWGRLGAATAPLGAVGLVLFVAGLALRWYAIAYLGRFFTVNVAIASDHRVIDTGPYRYVRHPSYAGALLAFLGLGLCLGNWASILCTVVPPFCVFLWRMRVEEAALVAGLGPEYREYMGRTQRLIPAIY
jgi:protein-S-isoprenylcysteine O-methyltransferase